MAYEKFRVENDEQAKLEHWEEMARLWLLVVRVPVSSMWLPNITIWRYTRILVDSSVYPARMRPGRSAPTEGVGLLPARSGSGV